MSIGTRTPSLQVLLDAADDVIEWGAGLPRSALGQARYPSPDIGLPPGWVPVAHRFDFDRHSFYWLACRDVGGWVIMSHDRDAEHTLVVAADTALGDLYTRAANSTVGTDRFSKDGAQIAKWLKDVLVGMFDPDDPVEAAERMLFTMTGDLTFVPRRAR